MVKTINLGLIPVLNNLSAENWFQPYGMIEDAFFNILFYILFEVVLTVIDTPQYIKVLRRIGEKALGKRSLLT